MATRTHLINRVKIYDPGPVYKTDYQALGGYLSFSEYEETPLETEREIVEKRYDTTNSWFNMRIPVSDLGTQVFDAFPEPGSGKRVVETVRHITSPIDAVIITPHPETTAHHESVGNLGLVAGGQDVDLTFFRPVEGLQDTWTDGYGGEYAARYMGIWPMMMQLDGSAPDTISGIESLFKLPAYPVFCFALGRPEPMEGMTETPGTWIEFSKSGPNVTPSYACALWLPYNGECGMYYRHSIETNSEWRALPKLQRGSINATEIHNPNWKSTQDVEPTLIWVGWFNNRILVSTDGFISNTAAFSTQLTDPYVKSIGKDGDGDPIWSSAPFGDCLPSTSSTITFKHRGGKWEVVWIPVFHHSWGGLLSPVHKLAYNLNAHITAVNTAKDAETPPAPHGVDYNPVWVSPVAGPGQVVVTTCAADETRATKILTNRYGLDFKAMLYSGHWMDSFSTDVYLYWPNADTQLAFPGVLGHEYHHDLTPVLYRVDYWLDGVLTENIDVSISALKGVTADIEQDLKSFEFQRSDSSGTATGVLDPNDAAIDDLNDTKQRYFVLDPYFKDVANNTIIPSEWPVFAGYTNGMQASVQGKVTGNISAFDILAAAGECQVDATLPPFDGWYVREAILFLLAYCGVKEKLLQAYQYYKTPGDNNLFYWGVASTIENLGTRLNTGDPSKPIWVAEKGSSPIELIREMCFYDYGAALWCEQGAIWKGCPYCRMPRNNVSNYNHLSGIIDHESVMAHVSGGYASTACLTYDGHLATGFYDSDRITHAQGGGVDAYAHFRFFSKWADAASYSDVSGMPYLNELLSIQSAPVEIQSEYYNSIRVEGHSMVRPNIPWAKEVSDWSSIVGDSNSVFPLGRKKPYTISREWLNADYLMNRVLEIAAARYGVPPRYVDITVPYQAEYRLGRTFAIHGPLTDAVWAKDKLFRITGVASSGARGQTPPGISELRGVMIGTANLPVA